MEVSKDQNAGWTIDVFQRGGTETCLYSWCCSCCAMGDIRSQLDGSNYYVSCCCISVPAMRWMVRTAYNIEGNAQWDCWTAYFCPCCSINQMLQTVQERGRAPVDGVGPEFNLNRRIGFNERNGPDLCWDAFYALLCLPCAVGLVMQNVGMPCWFGACCVNPFAATSILRYHNRIHACDDSENWCDCWFPVVTAPCFLARFLLPPVTVFGSMVTPVSCLFAFRNLVEENHRVHRTGFYGCNVVGCVSCCVSYCLTCTCKDPEGRYLVKAVPHLAK
jgi:Cys-rich protein (TIGR01571 family)